MYSFRHNHRPPGPPTFAELVATVVVALIMFGGVLLVLYR